MFRHLIVLIVSLCVLSFLLTSCAQPQTVEPESPLTTEIEKGSYGVGYNMAQQANQQFSGALDAAAFRAGVSDAMADAESRLPQSEAQAAIMALLSKRDELASASNAANASEGEQFLAENGAREGVTTLDSGLQYEVLVAAEGPKPTASDEVTTHYEGRLINGEVFDSSYKRGEPATFPLGGVIRGWTEALQLMSVGEKWRLYIPPELAYGERGAPPSIPPQATLIFDVELLGIQ